MDYATIGWIMIAVWLGSLLYPWHPSWPAARWLLHLPVATLCLYGLYELSMPGHMNIRLDLPLIWGCLIVSGILYLIRICWFLSWRPVPREAKGRGSADGSPPP